MKKYMLMLGCVALLTGCTQSNIVKPTGEIEPNFNIVEGIELDHAQIKQDVADSFDDSDAAFKRGFEYEMDEKENLSLTISVAEGADPQEAAEFAAYLIRAFNDAAATQDFSYEKASDSSYGGYFNSHDIHVRVIPDVPELEESMWIVDQDIKAGENTPVTPLK